MKQKFKVEHKNKKFKKHEVFEKWLNNFTAAEVYFKDNGQDLLHIYIDSGGEILHCNLQAAIWNGTVVDLKTLKPNKNIGFVFLPSKTRTNIMDFVIEKIVYKKESK